MRPVLPSREDRRRARITRALRAGAGQASVRFASVGAGLVTIPLVIDGLGQERFGVWLTIASVSALLGAVDLGLGNGLVTAMAAAEGRNDQRAQGELLSSALSGLLLVSGLVGAVGTGLAFAVDWNDVFGVSQVTSSPTELRTAMLIAAAGITVGIAFSVGPRARDGLQQGATVAFWQLVGGAAQVVAVVVCWRMGLGLVAYSAAGMAGSVIGTVGAAAGLFVSRADLRPRARSVRLDRLREVMTTGLAYFVLAISATVAYQVDTLVIAANLGADRAATYGVAYRVMCFTPLIAGVFLTPFWPAYAEARAAGDVDWVRSTFRRTLRISLVATSIMAVGLFLLAPTLIRLWTGGSIAVPRSLLFVLMLFTIEAGLGGPLAVLLNGLARVREQAVLSAGMAAANLVLSLMLVDRLGVTGPPIATVVTQALLVLGPTLLIARRHLAGLELPTASGSGT